jgi:branched-chain amino acid transport system substrate-binding protein
LLSSTKDRRMRIPRRRLLAGLLAAPLIARAQPALLFSQAIELSGPAGRAGDAWRNGVEMALQEINAAGGVLGQQLQVLTFDSNNGRAAVQRALEGDVFALLGPVTSESAHMAAPLARAARIANITGADATDLTAPGGSLFRAGPGPAVRMPRLAAWLRGGLTAHRVSLVWTNNEFGRGGRDLLAHELQAHGVEVASDHGVVPGPAGYAAEVAAVARAAPDAAVIYLPEAECVHFLVEAQRQALHVPLVGDTTLAAPRVLAQVGAAANGVRCHMGFAAEAPEVAAFRARYLDSFKEEPDGPAAKGYTAVGMLAAGAVRMGRPDRAGLAEALHGLTLHAGGPAVILDASWDMAGEMDRATFLVEVREGKASVVATLTGQG